MSGEELTPEAVGTQGQATTETSRSMVAQVVAVEVAGITVEPLALAGSVEGRRDIRPAEVRRPTPRVCSQGRTADRVAAAALVAAGASPAKVVLALAVAVAVGMGQQEETVETAE